MNMELNVYYNIKIIKIKMLAIIRSTYFIKIVFSSIRESTKLKLLKYSKEFQKLLQLTLINYKLFKNKYVVIDKSNHAKEIEYINNREYVAFEGDYLNGQRNGKGKEYLYDGSLLFEGEYKNGKRTGRGKEFDGYCFLLFEGKYLMGKKHGFGKEYDDLGSLIFKGECFNDKNGMERAIMNMMS